MPLDNETKSLIEEGNRTITELRGKVESLEGKTADIIDRDTLDKMKADLAENFKSESAAKTELKALEDRLAEIEAKGNRPGQAARGGDALVQEHKQAFINYVRNPDDPSAQSELRAIEKKASEVNTGTGSSGGFGVPQDLATTIGRLAQDRSPIRQIARVQAGSVAYEELMDLNGYGTEWVGEGGTRNPTDTPELARIAPSYGSIVAKPRVTFESLDDLFFDVEGWLSGAAAREIAIAEGKAFVSGNGTNKPLGFLSGTPTDEVDGVRAFGTLQFRATGVADALSDTPFDDIIRLKYGTKAQYRANAKFVLNSNTMATYATVKDDQGQYLLQRAVAQGAPDMLSGHAAAVAEDMPNIAADAFPVAFGDFDEGYLISDLHGMRIPTHPIRCSDDI
jgi:HK97 family phage major capsid protein